MKRYVFDINKERSWTLLIEELKGISIVIDTANNVIYKKKSLYWVCKND
ncbi:MAG: hypothetical protein ACLRTD_25210 [Bacteroides sp.]